MNNKLILFIVRYEVLNDLNIIKDNMERYSRILHSGLNLVGEYFLNDKSFSYESFKKFEKYRMNQLKLNDDQESKQNQFFPPLSKTRVNFEINTLSNGNINE